MKRFLKKFLIYACATTLLVFGILTLIVLQPQLSYAHKVTYKNFSIYSNEILDTKIYECLDRAFEQIKSSAYYDTGWKMDICLNDGSYYPEIIKAVQGKAFAWGFYNKVVLYGTTDFTQNYTGLHGYKWNTEQLLAHEMLHCLQFKGLGLWHSRPVADIEQWKWEGYAEYHSRKTGEKQGMNENISWLLQQDKDAWALVLDDGTIVPKDYYAYYTQFRYCTEVKQMGFEQILDYKAGSEEIHHEMMEWYKGNQERQ